MGGNRKGGEPRDSIKHWSSLQDEMAFGWCCDCRHGRHKEKAEWDGHFAQGKCPKVKEG
jgi:hypothetical protein